MKLKQILKLIFILFVVFGVCIYLLAKNLNVTQPPIKADIIVCLGGGYVERLDKGIELYHEGYADKIIFTGPGIGLLDQDDKIGFWKIPFFEEKGIPKRDIYYLENMENTYTEIKAIKEYMLKNGYKRVLIVSDPPHSRRIQYLVDLFKYKKSSLEVKIIGSDVLWWNQNKYFDSLRAYIEATKEVLGMIYYYVRYSLFTT